MDKVLEKSKEYEQIVVEHDPLYDWILDVIEIVKDFIRTNKLIIYGGSGMDYALRLKGDKIYPDNAIPDLDFFSPDSVEHAYSLADILYHKGFKDVRTIRAIYVHTMRVDIVDNHFIADISYVPKKVFDSLPYLEYDGMRIIHPEFQKIDLHSSLSFPYDNSPREVIFDRWPKDVKRFNLLSKYYPTEFDPKGILGYNKVTIPSDITKYVLSGFLAYAVLYKYYSEALPVSKKVIKSEISFGDKITFDCFGDNIDIVHFDMKKAESELSLKNPKSFHAYINLIPESTVGEYDGKMLKIHNTRGKLISVNSLKFDGINVKIVNVHYLMKYFLSQAHLSSNKIANTYLAHYVSLLEMISDFEESFAKKYGENLPENINEIKSNPFFPSIYTYGNENYSSAYEVSINMIESELEGKPRYVLPINYYPDRVIPKKLPHPKFDYDKSEFFLEGGEPLH
jgi:hypothetical protein